MMVARVLLAAAVRVVFTTLAPADDERGRFAICPTIGWLSNVRTCHFSIRDVGRHVLDVWQRLLAVVVNHAFTDCPHCADLRLHDSSSRR
jgi:hypothetical protein